MLMPLGRVKRGPPWYATVVDVVAKEEGWFRLWFSPYDLAARARVLTMMKGQKRDLTNILAILGLRFCVFVDEQVCVLKRV
jgi:hypothetical protein